MAATEINIGFEGRVTQGGLKVQGEYIQGQLEAGNNYNPWTGVSATTNKQSKPQGWYTTISYRLDDFRLGVRGESYNRIRRRAQSITSTTTRRPWGSIGSKAKDKFKFSLNLEEYYNQYEAVIGQAEINI